MTSPRWYDYVTVNIYYLGLAILMQTLSPLLVPLLVQQFVGQAQQATYYGVLRLWSLMVAVLAQALMGALSDRSTLRWGRRRPFILLGTLLDVVFVGAIGFSAGLAGSKGFGFLFAACLALQVSSNTAHAAQQCLIPDLVPENRRGRFSGVKAVFEVPLPAVLVSFSTARLISAGDTRGGILVVVGMLALTAMITMGVREEPLREAPPRFDWTPMLRLAWMTGLFTAVILGMGSAVQWAARLADHISSVGGAIIVMGAAGTAAMLAAIVLGVWISIRISIGAAARQHPSFTWWVVNRLAYLVGAINLSTFAVFFLQARLGLKSDAAGPAAILMMIVGVLILVFALLSGWLADKFGRKRLVALSGIVAALGALIAVFAPNLTVIYLGGCFIGAATGLFYTANWALGVELAPREEAGRYLGISNLASAGAGAVGAFIGGPIADYVTARAPDAPGLGYVLLFAVYGVLFLFSALVLVRVQEPGRGFRVREGAPIAN